MKETKVIKATDDFPEPRITEVILDFSRNDLEPIKVQEEFT